MYIHTHIYQPIHTRSHFASSAQAGQAASLTSASELLVMAGLGQASDAVLVGQTEESLQSLTASQPMQGSTSQTSLQSQAVGANQTGQRQVSVMFRDWSNTMPPHIQSGWGTDTQLKTLANIPQPEKGSNYADKLLYKKAMIGMQTSWQLSQVERHIYFMEGRQDSAEASEEDIARHREGLVEEYKTAKSKPEKAAALAVCRQYNRQTWRQRTKGTATYSCFACCDCLMQAFRHIWLQMTK